MGVSVDKCREENIWEGDFFWGGVGWGGVRRVGEGKRSQKREAVELTLPTLCVLGIAQVQGNLIREKNTIWLH